MHVQFFSQPRGVRKALALFPFISFVLFGCTNNEKPDVATIAPPQTAKAAPPVKAGQQRPMQRVQHNINLSKLWGVSKKQVAHALQDYKLTDQDPIEKDNPDKLLAGGEGRTYNLGGGDEFNVSFNVQGYAIIVAVCNQEHGVGLGFTLDHWQDLFLKFGLPSCGEPAKTAPLAYYWGPPHNRTGGFEIKLFADEKGQVWQVQVRSPEDFFPE